ncbi:MAG: UrcA family protein [Sphingomonadaceae bacterium]
MKMLIIFGLVLATIPISAATAHRESVADNSVAVSYGDLDLSSEQGRDRLNARTRSAIRSVCEDNAVRDLNDLMAQKRCTKSMHANADSKIALAVEKANHRMALAKK